MSDLIKKLGQAEEMHKELGEAQRALMLKNGMLEDLMKDICVQELGFDKNAKELPLPMLFKKAYMAGYKAAKAEK